MNRISERVNIAACLGLALIILLPIGRAEGASENASKLLDLARKKFGTLTEAEVKLFRKVVNGEIADCSDESEKNNDPNGAEKWGYERVIRANQIWWLCTDPQASSMVTYWGIAVQGARIDGVLNLRLATISFPLSFWRCAFPRGINLGYVEISALDLSGTHTGPIYGDGVNIEGNVFLRNGFKAEGEVNLLCATIGRNLECDGSQFINKGARALNADGLKVEGDVFLRNDFKAEGEVRLVGATIGGVLDCEKGMFIKPTGYALLADDLNIKGSAYLHNGFQADGVVSLGGATIDRSFAWTDVNSPEKATLDLRSATVGTLWDDQDSWPDEGRLLLHGLVYKEIDDDAPRDAESRIDWLRRQPGFRPQPYEQLAAVLRKSGQDDDAKKILIAKNEDRARLTKLTWSEKWWYRVLGPMIGYGYRPLNALWGVVAFVALGWILFGIGYWGGLVTPQNESAYVERSVSTVGGTEVRELSDVYPRFNFLVYSFDVFVPLIDLHQAKYWLPNASRGPALLSIKGFALHTGGLLRLYLWVHITMGWAITMLLVAGLTGLIRT